MSFLKSILRFHILNLALDAFFSKVVSNFRGFTGAASGSYTGEISVGQSFSEIRWVGHHRILTPGHVWKRCYITRVHGEVIFYDIGDGRNNWELRTDLEFYL